MAHGDSQSAFLGISGECTLVFMAAAATATVSVQVQVQVQV